MARDDSQEWDDVRFDVSTNNKVLIEIATDVYMEEHNAEPPDMHLMILNNMVNRIVFGKEAWRWRRDNPDAAKYGGNQRDCADTVTLKLLDTIEKDAALLTAMKVPRHEIEQKLVKKAKLFRDRLTPYYDKHREET